MHDVVELLDHVHRDPDRARLVGDRAGDGLADPPRRVGRELVAAAVVELLDRADQAERSLLDQVEEREAAAQVALRDRDDEAQVGLHHLLLGVHVAALDPLREAHLLLGGEQLDLPDRAQVEAQRVEAGLDRQVELGALGLGHRRRRRDGDLVVGRQRLDDLECAPRSPPRRGRSGARASRAAALRRARSRPSARQAPRASGSPGPVPPLPAPEAPRPQLQRRREALLLLQPAYSPCPCHPSQAARTPLVRSPPSCDPLAWPPCFVCRAQPDTAPEPCLSIALDRYSRPARWPPPKTALRQSTHPTCRRARRQRASACRGSA